MTSNSVEDVMDHPLAEASAPEAPQSENTPVSSPTPSNIPLPDTKSISFTAESSPDPSAASSPSQPSARLFFPLASTLAGKTGITLSELVADFGNNLTVAPDIATAEMVVAVDGSFVDTSSGSAARGFKKLLDQDYGVNVQIRSPYAITGFVNQHGQQRYRVGLRDQLAPAETSSSRNTLSKASTDSHSPNQKRRSRLSMHFLPPTIFKNGSTSNRPQTAAPSGSGSKKARRTRSIPDLTDFGEAGQRPQPRIITSGRTHSQSVTSLDAPRVVFDSPTLKQPDAGPVPPVRQLQEKYSFESTQTARQIDTTSPTHSSAVSLPSGDESPDRPASALRIRSSPLEVALPSDEQEDDSYVLSPDIATLTQYSTRVFDVLQTYRGLPQLDRFSPESADTTVIKFSLSADDTAAPRDDPRFVIWGESNPDWDHDDHSVSRDSYTDGSVSTSSRRRSKAKSRPSDASRSSHSKGSAGSKVLLAATIERWIAQLTSDLNYDELLNFFLTYRTYVTAIDLCQLLICRFHWALQKPVSSADEKVRRIVRVRTFVAIRYWLLTFFTVDFLPNRELRILMTKWLNSLLKDPVLKKNYDGLGIVKRLIKVAKECKQAHTQQGKSPKVKPERPVQTQDHVLGKKFAEIVNKKAQEEGEDSDLDLDFLPEEAHVPDSSRNDIANANIVVATNITNHAPGPSSNPDSASTHLPVLPIHQSALSRAFVKTIGRLGRWTRVLNSRSITRSPISACADVSAFDLDLNVERDLLTINGGVETYLKAAEARQPQLARGMQTSATLPSAASSALRPESSTAAQSEQAPAEESGDDALTPVLSHFAPSSLSTSAPEAAKDAVSPPPDYDEAVRASTNQSKESQSTQEEHEESTPARDDVDEFSPSYPISIATTSTMSFGIPLSELGQNPTFPPLGDSRWQFDIASLDDLDLSDGSDHENVLGLSAPPGLKKPSRKLPLRRDFEFAPRPETVSSLGIISRASVTSGPSTSSMSSTSMGIGGNIQPWQLNALIDSLSDDEETGDVEAALRSLEGHINPERQQEKTSKVNGWVRHIRERLANGDYGDEEPRFPIDSDEEEDMTSAGDQSTEQSTGQSSSTTPTSEPTQLTLIEQFKDDDDSATTPISDQLPLKIPPPPGLDPPTSSSSTNSKPSPEEVVPQEILQNRVPPSPVSQSEELETPLSRFSGTITPRAHHSFVLGIRAEVLARHFSMIDRELFMGIKFEELVLDDWAGTEEIDILDWTEYLKDRARFKAEHRFPEKTSALAAVRARFNLTANFVVSEIVLTQPSERPMIVGKFVRIAWKCYGQSNFHTLTAIVAALQSDWVNKAMRKSAWHRIGIFEARVLKDLKEFTSSINHFKFIRQVTDAIAESKPLETSSASVVSSGGDGKGKQSDRPQVPTACIPFIGAYLSQLHCLGKLPDLIDPTAPHQSVGVNPSTNTFDPLYQPDVFSSLAPLPDSMNLEPLINVHKQRRIAEVIKSLVAGQHLASRVQFEVDKKIFNRCLRLRALDGATLQRVLNAYSE
ncbi:Guanine nucleotide exchange factor LTE1 [Leucoagaricus sp. SymC.cos]|nr:Guanine nucleotide exchange factor LTE1 [Leucoagaricus sp. SymC.cos]